MLHGEGHGYSYWLSRFIMRPVLIATSNAGKLRDFAGAAAPFGVTILGIPNFQSLPEVVEDGLTFEANASKKAAQYSLYAAREIVLADDSGLEVDALHGAPGVHSARYAALEADAGEAASSANSSDDANNARLLRELAAIPPDQRTACFVCVLSAALDGKILAVFSARAEGLILDSPRGNHGFGYDPLFFFPQLNKTFAELTPEEKAQVSHRGAAFRTFLEWNKCREPR
jgi:XTP/dITP diphosphohydrolase